MYEVRIRVPGLKNADDAGGIHVDFREQGILATENLANLGPSEARNHRYASIRRNAVLWSKLVCTNAGKRMLRNSCELMERHTVSEKNPHERNEQVAKRPEEF